MKKLVGYIPIMFGEEVPADAVMINGARYRQGEIWIPGAAQSAEEKKEEVKPKEFEALERQRAKGIFRVCKHCGKTQDEHVFFKLCPIKQKS